MTNRSVLTIFLYLSALCSMAQEEVSYVKDSLKCCIKEYRSDTVAMVMAVADSVRLPVTEDGTLVIPASVTLEGRTYKVKGPATDGFVCHPEIRHLVFSEGVTNVEWKSFSYCLNLESIHIPTTVTWVAPSSFDGCSNLRSITVEKGNAKYDSRNNCNAIIETSNNTLVQGCANTIIPTEIKTIGSSAFEDQQISDSLILPQGIKGIGHYAFRGCTGLRHITLPDSLEFFGTMTFAECTNLQEIFLPEKVEGISGDVFADCPNLRRIIVAKGNETYDSRDSCNAIIETDKDCLVVGCRSTTIVEGIKSIDSQAFFGSSITGIHIPASVTQIGEEAFSDCRFCTSIEVAPGNPVYNSREGCNAIIETATGTLVQGCGKTTFPSGVKKIGNYAFCGMTMPTNYVIPEGITSIGEHAFTGCDLRTVRLPSSLQEIGMSAFSFCNSMESVDMSACREVYIGRFVFCYCDSLTHVSLPQKGIYAGSDLFDYTPYQEVYEREHGDVGE